MNKREQIISIIILVFIAIILKHFFYGFPGINWTGRTIIASIFATIGFWIRKLVFQYENNIYYFLTLLIVIICAWINGAADLSSFNIPYVLIYLIGGVSGTLFIVYTSKLIPNSIVTNVGRNSLIIMGTHQLAKYYIVNKFPSLWAWSTINFTVYIISVIVLEVIAIILFRMIHLHHT